MNRMIALTIVALFAFQGSIRAQDKAPAPQTQSAAQVGEARVRTLPAITYFHRSIEATLKTLPDRIHQALPVVLKSAEESKARIVGSPVLVYHGVTADVDAKFTFDIGFPIADADIKPADDCKVIRLPEFRCLSLLYTGDLEHLPSAYEKLGPAFDKQRVLPTDESRQMMLYWEKQDSPNNVIQVMIGLK